MRDYILQKKHFKIIENFEDLKAYKNQTASYLGLYGHGRKYENLPIICKYYYDQETESWDSIHKSFVFIERDYLIKDEKQIMNYLNS